MADLTAFYGDKLLAELAVGYGGQRFIAGRALPIVGSPNQSGKFQTFDASNFLLDTVNSRVSTTSDVQYIEFDASATSYSCDGFSWQVFVPNVIDEDTAGSYLRGATQAVQGQLLRIREKLALDLILACGNSTTITTKWDAASTTFGTVVAGVEEMKTTVRDAVGVDPNVLIVGSDVWAVMAQHMANVGNPLAASPADRAVVAERLGIEELLVSQASYKTAVGDDSTAMWTAKYAAMLYRGGTVQNEGSGDLETSIFEPAYGKLAYWRAENLVNGVEMMRIENPLKGSHGGYNVRGIMYIDPVETLNDAATLAQVLT